MRIDYHIQVVGYLWLPRDLAAIDMNITESEWNVVDTDFKNLTLEQIEHYIITHTGDFSEIIDFTVEKCEVGSPYTEDGEDGWKNVTNSFRYTQMKDWDTEENQIKYLDCNAYYLVD
jgi:hypothetical protein